MTSRLVFAQRHVSILPHRKGTGSSDCFARCPVTWISPIKLGPLHLQARILECKGCTCTESSSLALLIQKQPVLLSVKLGNRTLESEVTPLMHQQVSWP